MKKLIILFGLVLCYSSIFSQPLDFCGILPPNSATSSDPDSIYYDRFGNSYDIDFINNAQTNVIICSAGLFEIHLEDYIPQEVRDVVCQVFTDLSALFPPEYEAFSCGDFPTIDPVGIEV